MHALDRASGASRWKQDKLLRRKLTAPVVVDGKIVVGDSLGYLHVLSKDDGALVGRLAVDGGAVNAMVPAMRRPSRADGRGNALVRPLLRREPRSRTPRPPR